MAVPGTNRCLAPSLSRWLLFVPLVCLCFSRSDAFAPVPPCAPGHAVGPGSRSSASRHNNAILVLRASKHKDVPGVHDDDNDEEEFFTPNRTSASPGTAGDPKTSLSASPGGSNNCNNSYNDSYLDDLTPPPVNFARNSILFSEQPSTRVRNNSSLDAWRFARNHLPAAVTGAWPWRDQEALEQRPLAALYNAAFVRLPVLGVAASYLYQKTVEGHDLVMDFGFDATGPQAIPPVVVLAVLVLILL